LRRRDARSKKKDCFGGRKEFYLDLEGGDEKKDEKNLYKKSFITKGRPP